MKNEPLSSRPKLWGWDDESIYFNPDPADLQAPELRIQDYPDLYRRLVEECERFFKTGKGED